MFTKFKTIKKHKRKYQCYNCYKPIDIGEAHTYGATTDSDITRYKNEIVTGRFCTECRPLSANEDQHNNGGCNQ